MTNDDLARKNSYLLGSPKYTVIERTAGELAGTWYEIGRGQGLKSKWKDSKSFARANFTKFIPKAVEILISMLGRSDIHELQKEEIYGALMERHNDPRLVDAMPNFLPDIDITKLLPKQDRIPDVTTQIRDNILLNKTNVNPYKAKRH